MKRAAIAVVVLIAAFTAYRAASRLIDYYTGDDIHRILWAMQHDGEAFDAAPLNALGAEGLENAFDRIMKDSSDQIGIHGMFEFRRSTHYADGFRVYVDQLHDQQQLSRLADLVVAAIGDQPPILDRRDVIAAAIGAIVRTKDDSVIDRLAPLLTHKDWGVSNLVVDELRPVVYEDHRFTPTIYIAGLDSSDERVFKEASNELLDCYEPAKRPRIYAAFRRHFHGADDERKFETAFALMYEFQDAEAIAYLVEQTASSDHERAETALRWLSDTHMPSRLTPEIREAFLAHLHSSNEELRAAAIQSLARYTELENFEIVLPLLVDANPKVAAAARQMVLHVYPRDDEFAPLKEMLLHQANVSGSAALRDASMALLGEMAAHELIDAERAAQAR